MPLARVPAEALPALRAQVERFLREHGVDGGAPRADIDLDATTLGEFLLAALRYVREEHPWPGRKGAVVDPPEPYRDDILTDLFDALPSYDSPLTVDGCIDALARAVPFTVVDAPCSRRRAAPRVYPYTLDSWPAALRDFPFDGRGQVFGVVAEEGWIRDIVRRNEAFCAALPPNDEPMYFVELDAAAARRLAAVLFAGPERPGAQEAFRAEAEAFVRLFGPAARCFGFGDPAHGAAWSRYDASSNGSWGRALALVVTDGLRVASLDAVWDVASE